MSLLKRNDLVQVISGVDKGKRGKVLRVIPDKGRVVVAGVNVVTKHVKPTRQNQRGGIERREAPIHLSNVMVADPKSGEPTRVGFKVLESGQKVRVAKKSGEQIDT